MKKTLHKNKILLMGLALLVWLSGCNMGGFFLEPPQFKVTPQNLAGEWVMPLENSQHDQKIEHWDGACDRVLKKQFPTVRNIHLQLKVDGTYILRIDGHHPTQVSTWELFSDPQSPGISLKKPRYVPAEIMSCNPSDSDTLNLAANIVTNSWDRKNLKHMGMLVDPDAGLFFYRVERK